MPPLLKRNDTVGEGLNLERWRITRKIGEGQFAEVYEVSADHVIEYCASRRSEIVQPRRAATIPMTAAPHMAAQAIDTFKEGRKVALKVDRLLDPKTVEREAKVLKRLQPCPCVVRLLEQGTHDQRGFMIMEVGDHARLEPDSTVVTKSASKRPNARTRQQDASGL